MSVKLFVGGLAWTTTDDLLRAAFSQFGEIEDAHVVNDRETGRSRGFGHVTYSDEDAAEQAIWQLNGKDIEGRNITVRRA